LGKESFLLSFERSGGPLSFETMFPREASETWEATRRLRDEARLVRRGGWFPVLLFGIAELGSLPLYKVVLCDPQYPFCTGQRDVLAGVGPTPVTPIAGHGHDISIYWVTACACVFGLTVAYYRHRGSVTGIRGKTWPMVDTGAILLAFVLMIGNWIDGWPFAVGTYGTEPLLIVGLSLLVLARTERSGTLATIALVYVGIVVASLFYNYVNLFGRFGFHTPFRKDAELLPNILIPGVYLIVTSLVLRRLSGRRGHIRGESFERPDF
jgi:hypothetical protein